MFGRTFLPFESLTIQLLRIPVLNMSSSKYMVYKNCVALLCFIVTNTWVSLLYKE